MSLKDLIKKFWNYLKEDSWHSWLVSLILILIFIRFVFFPTLSFITASPLPLVVVESCSMYHESDLKAWWTKNAAWYKTNDISEGEFITFPLRNGFTKGDIIAVWGRSPYKVGDVIVFTANPDAKARHPIIHRIITRDPIATKGDNNAQQLTRTNNNQNIDETNISEERIMGKAVFRIPLLGWLKLIFFEPFREDAQRGFCT